MILLADSGSTKTDWIALSEKREASEHRSKGLNPFYQSTEEMISDMSGLADIFQPEQIRKLFFYGAGCSTAARKNDVKKALSEVFPMSIISVNDDLLAAGKAVFGQGSGLVCILGTGSNSGYYDSLQITRNIPGLGFLLGDEGSGATLGKKLVGHYLRDELPGNIKEYMEQVWEMDKSVLYQRVYLEPFPNRFLAGFVKPISAVVDDGFIRNLIFDHFEQFFHANILKYPKEEYKKIGFVGSLAYYFKDILREVAAKYDVTTHQIIKSPIKSLVRFHLGEGVPALWGDET